MCTLLHTLSMSLPVARRIGVRCCVCVSQCVTVLCIVLQCVGVRCGVCVLQCATVYCSVSQCVAVCCSVLKFVIVCCIERQLLQCFAACCSVPWPLHVFKSLHTLSTSLSVARRIGIRCCVFVLQCIAECCSAFQCVAVCCNLAMANGTLVRTLSTSLSFARRIDIGHKCLAVYKFGSML